MLRGPGKKDSTKSTPAITLPAGHSVYDECAETAILTTGPSDAAVERQRIPENLAHGWASDWPVSMLIGPYKTDPTKSFPTITLPAGQSTVRLISPWVHSPPIEYT